MGYTAQAGFPDWEIPENCTNLNPEKSVADLAFISLVLNLASLIKNKK